MKHIEKINYKKIINLVSNVTVFTVNDIIEYLNDDKILEELLNEANKLVCQENDISKKIKNNICEIRKNLGDF